MSATSLLVRRDLRKRGGQAITLFILTVLAATLLNAAIVLLSDYNSNIDRKVTQWNSPSAVSVVSDGAGLTTLANSLAADSNVTSFEVAASHTASGSLPFGDGELAAFINIVDLAAPVTIGTIDTVSQSDEVLVNPIWAPLVLEASGLYGIGDPVTITTTAGEVTFHIQGFIEELYGGSPSMGLLTFALPAGDFAAFAAPGFAGTANVKVIAPTPRTAMTAIDTGVKAALASLAAGEHFVPVWSQDLDLMKQASGMATAIFVAMLVALAVIIVVIAAVVTRFVLRNLITTDLTSIGMLRAAGHTTGGIIASLVTTSALITATAGLAGIGLTYVLLPGLESAFRAQNGIRWEPQFSAPAAAITSIVLLSIVAGIAALAALRVRKATTVGALRGGIATHSTARTHLPLDATSGNLPVLLGLKASLRQAPQNIVMAITVAAVAFSAVFGLGMVYNLFGDTNKATELLVGNVEDVTIQVNPGADTDAILASTQTMPGVESAILATIEGLHVSGTNAAFVITDDPAANQSEPLVAGRMPTHPNEVAIGGRLSDLLGLQVGDLYRIELSDAAADFIVTGITSSARNLGQMMFMSTAGFQRLEPTFEHDTIWVYAPTDRAAVIAEIKATFGADLAAVIDQRESVESQLRSYLSIVPAVGVLVVVFTIVVTALVVALVVTTMLIQTHRELGVKKAMGYTTAELSRTTRWTYLPAIGLGAIAGAVAGAFATGPLLGLLLRNIGILQLEVSIDWLQVGGIIAVILGFAWFITWLSSRRIRRVSAYALVTE